MNYEEDVGFFLTEIWRFGPVYSFLSIAAQCLMLDMPFRFEYESGESPLSFDGNTLNGSPEYVASLEKCVRSLEDDFVYLVRIMEFRGQEFNSLIANNINSESAETEIEGSVTTS